MKYARIKKFSTACSLALVFTTSGYYLYSETFGLERRKRKRQLKIDNEPVPVPPKMNSLINQVMNDMKLKPEERSLIMPIMTGSVILNHSGFTGGKFGTLLEIPHYFILDNQTKFNVTLVVNDIELPKDTKPADVLKSTIAYSDDAKKFAMAREIYQAGHSSFYTFPVLSMILISLFSKITSAAHKDPLKRVNKLIGFFHFELFFVGLWFYVLFYDFNSVYRECDADLCASQLGKSYIEGGIEYYEKMLERNKAIKKINEKAPYDDKGDIDVSIFRTTHMSLERRIAYLKEILKSGGEITGKHSAMDYISLWKLLHKSGIFFKGGS